MQLHLDVKYTIPGHHMQLHIDIKYTIPGHHMQLHSDVKYTIPGHHVVTFRRQIYYSGTPYSYI